MRAKSSLTVTTCFLLAAVLLCPAGYGKKKSASLLDAAGSSIGNWEPINISKGDLLWELAHNPSLLDVNYLQYYLGKPDAVQNQGTERISYWYDRMRRPLFELHTAETGYSGQQRSSFIANLPGSGIPAELLPEIYGTEAKRFFDFQSQATELYSPAPDTHIAFTAPKHAYGYKLVKIMYAGNRLPAPTAADLDKARQHLASKASMDVKNPQWQDLVGLLEQRVNEQPDDPGVRLAYAQALAKSSRVHEAIHQYKNVLSITSLPDPLKKQALDGLRSLQALDGHVPAAAAVQRKLVVVDKGQHVRVAGTVSDNDNKQAAPANP